MSDLPKFQLYGEEDPGIEGQIQGELDLRPWSSVSKHERETFLQDLYNRDWIGSGSMEVLAAVERLNTKFLRERPGQELHKIKPMSVGYSDNSRERANAAFVDFQRIMLTSNNDGLVFRLISELANCYIDGWAYNSARKEQDTASRQDYIKKAFSKFDRFATTMNYLFRQFAINQQLTRGGLVPVQDARIAEEIYKPVLTALADPRFTSVNKDLAGMFDDYRTGSNAEAITKAHSAVQRFLQVLLGEEGKNAKGELGDLFRRAKQAGLISTNRFGEALIRTLEGFFPSERATNSTAKPALKEASPRDAKLMLDLVLVFFQHCLSAPS